MAQKTLTPKGKKHTLMLNKKRSFKNEKNFSFMLLPFSDINT